MLEVVSSSSGGGEESASSRGHVVADATILDRSPTQRHVDNPSDGHGADSDSDVTDRGESAQKIKLGIVTWMYLSN